MNQDKFSEFVKILRRAAKPPVGEVRFWLIQVMVIVIAVTHLLVDLYEAPGRSTFPSGIPVALLIVPVIYAALRYGLSGSAATGLWATFLWAPDLMLPHDQGHTGADIVSLALIDIVAFFVGRHVEIEKISQERIRRITQERVTAQMRFRQLFEANGSPILVLDGVSAVIAANPAAKRVFGNHIEAGILQGILDVDHLDTGQTGQVFSLTDGQDYRIDVVSLDVEEGQRMIQVVFENVTFERNERRRIRRYAELVVKAEEEQRKRLSRELHDEPLQLFLHLARRLEFVSDSGNLPSEVVESLQNARHQALDAAKRLRNLAADLRPPALDQLGLVPAIKSLLSVIEDQSELLLSLQIIGESVRLDSEVELGVFRIVQESVGNSVRHSMGKTVHVVITFGPNELRATIGDDGIGFDRNQVPEPDDIDGGHLGLIGMRERASSLGGHLEVSSTLGVGTFVLASIPFGKDTSSSIKRHDVV